MIRERLSREDPNGPGFLRPGAPRGEKNPFCFSSGPPSSLEPELPSTFRLEMERARAWAQAQAQRSRDKFPTHSTSD